MNRELLGVAARALDARRPYAVATVVSRQRPSSAQPGNTAVITADGTLHGWIGGSCTRSEVVRQALAALADGQPRLVSFTVSPEHEHGQPPSGRSAAGPADGRVHVPMSCSSGGKVEVHINPVVPSPLLLVVGETPVADAVATLGAAMGYGVARGLESVSKRSRGGRFLAVVATMSAADERALEKVLAADPDYAGIVVSPRRMGQVREALAARGVCRSKIAKVRGPAGLDIGAHTPEEIAVSVFAEVVALGAGRSGTGDMASGREALGRTESGEVAGRPAVSDGRESGCCGGGPGRSETPA